ncbi:hypothetical protein GBAR_LOCUS25540, partial [Geodia barretti]
FTDADKIKPSLYLKSASISQRGSTVVIDCEFSEVYPEASCVLVYREYGSPLLTVVELSQRINFPVYLSLWTALRTIPLHCLGKMVQAVWMKSHWWILNSVTLVRITRTSLGIWVTFTTMKVICKLFTYPKTNCENYSVTFH